MKRYTIDTSVLIASILPNEQNHNLAKDLINKIFIEECEIVLPVTILIEIASAIVRRTKNKNLARENIKLLASHIKIKIVELNLSRAAKSIEVAFDSGLRTLDSILLQVSKEYNTELITFDKEILSKIQ